jgi:polar amino acid transport system substrate-binding protein
MEHRVTKGMSRRFWVTIVCFALMLGVVTATSAREAEPPPVLLVTGEWPPYTGAKLEGGGLAVELVRAVFAEMGRNAEIRFYPWRRCEAYVRQGMAWATFPFAITEERRAQYLFSDPLIESDSVLFYYGSKMASFELNELSDLRPYTIGASSGYWYEKMFREAGLRVAPSLDDLTGLKQLKMRRVDLHPMERRVGLWLIDHHFEQDRGSFGIVEKSLRTNQNALMVSKSHPDSRALLEAFNAALQQVREKSIHRRIMERDRIGFKTVPRAVPRQVISRVISNLSDRRFLR